MGPDHRSTTPSRALDYDGRVGELYRIFLVNLLLTILTLGIYRCWALTRYRRYLWSRMSFQGHRFEYVGTGGELFVGVLLAGMVLLGVFAAAGLAVAILPGPLKPLPVPLAYAVIAVLAAAAIYSAQRYRLSRTLWCGIRGGLAGSALGYGVRAIAYYALVVVTLFQMSPWVTVRLAEARINASSFGDMPFTFRGRARALYGPFLLTMVATIMLLAALWGVILAMAWPTLASAMASSQNVPSQEARAQLGHLVPIVLVGYAVTLVAVVLLRSWYVALVARHIVGHTALGAMRLASSVTGRGLLRLTIGNVLLLLVTLGLGYPIVLHRDARFLAATLYAFGRLDPATVAQTTLAATRYGEGMFQQLDASGVL